MKKLIFVSLQTFAVGLISLSPAFACEVEKYTDINKISYKELAKMSIHELLELKIEKSKKTNNSKGKKIAKI